MHETIKQKRAMIKYFEQCKKIDCRTIKEKKIGLIIEYTDTLNKKIVQDSINRVDANNDIFQIMTNQKKYHRNSIAAIDDIKSLLNGIIKQEYPLIFDYDSHTGKAFCHYGEQIFKQQERVREHVDYSYLFSNNEDNTPYYLYNQLYYKDACLLACKNGHIKILNEHFESSNRAKNIFNNDYLITAAIHGHEDIVIYLIARGLNVNLALKYGTPEVQLLAKTWINEHPEGQKNLNIIEAEINEMKNNPPIWMDFFSYPKLKFSKVEQHACISNADEAVNIIYESVAYIRNNAGDAAVEKYLNKILLNELPHEFTEEEIKVAQKKLWAMKWL